MPKLWNETIEAHRRSVHDAILDTTVALAAEHGPLSVTMSQIAERVGIGRATLYKYFRDVESILIAWHKRVLATHLTRLEAARDAATGPGGRLTAVLAELAHSHRERGQRHGQRKHGDELSALVHADEHFAEALGQLHELLCELLTDAAEAGLVRTDVPAGELATYCEHALHGAAEARSEAALGRLVQLTTAGLRPAAVSED